MRLYDHLMREPMRTAGIEESQCLEITERMRETLGHCECFVIDNIADYFLSQPEKDHWDLSQDFPNVALPFDVVWMEYRRPVCATDPDFPAYIGWNFHTWPIDGQRDIDGVKSLVRNTQYADKRMIDATSGDTLAVKWVTFFALVYRANGVGNVGPGGAGYFLVDANGGMLGQPAFTEIVDERTGDAHDMTYVLTTAIAPCLLALSFLHCKNVRVYNAGPDRPLTHREVRQKQRPLVTYRVLDIVPMRQVLDREGHAQETGLKRALHICRGHFADYTEGPGLFGKHHGRFWVPSHVRGSADAGIALKDYRVKAPAGTEG